MPKTKLIDIIAYLLIIYSALVLVILVLYFAKHSPSYVTHDQFASALGILGSGMFAGFIALWTKMMSFAQSIGRVEGKLNGFTSSINTRSQEKLIPSPSFNIQNVQQQGRSNYAEKDRKS